MTPDYEITSDQGHVVRAYKPTNPALPSLGYGGHPIGARPKRRALTVYQGRQPFTLEVPMILWRDGGSVEVDREALDNMATTEAELLTQQPPVVQLEAIYPLPIPPALGTQKTARWWLENLTWGEEFRRPPEDGGYMTWKEVTVTLLEWSPNPTIDGGLRIGSYRVKKPPDTMKSIAAKHNMTVKQFKEANPTIRSDGSLRDGQIVKCQVFTPFSVKPEP